MKIVFFCFASFVITGCYANCTGSQDVVFPELSSATANFTLEVSVSLQKPEELVQPLSIDGKSFCLTDKGVVYPSRLDKPKQPCFQLMPGQNFANKVDPKLPPYQVVDPEKFYTYYQSIPKDLNLFLAIKMHRHNTLLKNSGFAQETPTSLANLWSNDYNTKGEPTFVGPKKGGVYVDLYSLLHSFVLAAEDSFIYVYLPLNIGIETPELKGVSPSGDFGSPLVKLSSLQDTALLKSSVSEEFERCIGYKKLSFSAALPPEKFEKALLEYKALVDEYLKNHKGAFPDPYATP